MLKRLPWLVSLWLMAAALPLTAQQKKPNILVIFGDDIGMWNVGAYTHGMMGRTPNIDSIAKNGILFTDHYGQPSCTAGRAAFITGQLPVRTGMTTIGIPGSPRGIQKEDPTLAEVLKSVGLQHRTIRQEPSWGPQRISAHGTRLRRVVWQPLSPERRRGAGRTATIQGRRTRHTPRSMDRAACCTHGRPRWMTRRPIQYSVA